MAVRLLGVLLALGATQPTAAEGGSNSIAKVIAMLQDMAVKCKKEKDEEAVAFAEFETYCKMEQGQLTDDVAEGGARIESLGAEISKLTEEAVVLGDEIAALGSDLDKFTAEKKAEEEQRAKDHAAYLVEVKDYSESVSALERAIDLLASKNKDIPGAAALLQLTNSKAMLAMPSNAQSYLKGLLSVLQAGGEDAFSGAYAAPEANAYESQTGGIIDMLKNLLKEFSEKKGQCQKEEMNAAHASNMIVNDLTDSIENANDDVAAKTKLKGEKEAKAAQLKGELQTTIDVLKQDKITLKDLKTECHQKGLSFHEKQTMRSEEIEAIEQASEIMQSEAVSFIQMGQQRGRASSLLQIARAAAGVDASVVHNKHRRIIQFLESEGKRLKSAALGVLAQRMESGYAEADIFAKVKKMIWDMIKKLQKEAFEDAQHEGFCDTEMGKSKVTRNKLNEDIDGLSSEIEALKATIVELSEEIATLSKEIEELQAGMKEATAMRNEEKAKNKATIADAKKAQSAVAAATAVLKEFYEKAKMATALVQQGKAGGIKMGTDEWDALANPNFEGTIDPGHKAGMATFGKAYKGNQDAAGGVMALLEVIASDFAQLEADTSAAEEVAKHTYEDFMAESKKGVAVKTRKIEMDEEDKSGSEASLNTATTDLKATEDELLAAERYFDKLKPQCVAAGVTFEERQAQRQAEIDSLKTALEILST